ncbi:MAG: DUF3256 family protein [Bacteroides sp.]|nr:DUF3256 family protein [Bacteroides sp.]
MSVTLNYNCGTTTAMRLAGVLVAVVAAFLPLHLMAGPEGENASEQVVEALPDSVMTSVSVVSPLDSLFVSSPISVLEILPPASRAAMIERSHAGQSATALSTLYSVSVLDTLEPDYLKLKLTEASELTLNLTEDHKKQPLLVVVYTVGAEGISKDSDIEFYDGEWNQLPKEKFWEMPEIKDFLTARKGEKVDLKKVAELVPFPTYILTVSPDARTITGSLTVDTYLSEEAKEELKPYLVPSRTWRWDGKKYKLEKIRTDR